MGCVTGQTTVTFFFLWEGSVNSVAELLCHDLKPICRNMGAGIRIRGGLSPFLAAALTSVWRQQQKW